MVNELIDLLEIIIEEQKLSKYITLEIDDEEIEKYKEIYDSLKLLKEGN